MHKGYKRPFMLSLQSQIFLYERGISEDMFKKVLDSEMIYNSIQKMEKEHSHLISVSMALKINSSIWVNLDSNRDYIIIRSVYEAEEYKDDKFHPLEIETEYEIFKQSGETIN